MEGREGGREGGRSCEVELPESSKMKSRMIFYSMSRSSVLNDDMILRYREC
jgi:hypothetical protein